MIDSDFDHVFGVVFSFVEDFAGEITCNEVTGYGGREEVLLSQYRAEENRCVLKPEDGCP